MGGGGGRGVINPNGKFVSHDDQGPSCLYANMQMRIGIYEILTPICLFACCKIVNCKTFRHENINYLLG